MNGRKAWVRGIWLLCLHTCSLAASFEEVKAAHQPSDTVILDRQGDVLHRLRTDKQARRGPWRALTDISPAMRTALVLSEDKRFYEHSGVDWQAVSAAAWANLWNTRTRGASTLTMQLAGLLDEDLRRSNAGRSVVQKIGQTISAQSLERQWRKDQILEAYLNLVPFRGELVGIEALSQTLFGKAAHGLNHHEAALAVALVRAPNAKERQVALRTCQVLKSLQAQADCEFIAPFVSNALARRDYAADEGIAPHVARQVAPTRGPSGASQRITTTLSAPLQRFAVQTLQTHLRELSGRHVQDGALLVLDNASGQVRAWVGSSGPLSQATQVDAVTALRQPGSTLKPFLYAQALAERRITAASLLEDSPAQIQTSGGLYIPQNYDHHFKGWVSTRTALGASLNVPAVRTLVMVSPDAFHKQLRRLGLPLPQSGDYFGYSLALGSAEVSLLDLTNTYRTLANGGRSSPTTLLPPSNTAPTLTPAPPPALDPRAAFIISDILSDPLARARTFGTDSVLATRFWTAVKTGTSKDMRDNWAIGYSQHYTVGVWVGNASGAPMWDVSGTTGAAPIWAATMNFLHSQQSSQAPQAPPGMVQQRVQFEGQAHAEAARQEWFITGTEQATFDTASQDKSTLANVGRITSPTHGSIIALDPDIPPQRQRLTLQAQGHNLRWLLDGKKLAQGNQALWLPWPGRHTLQITDAKGKVLDEVKLEVRGAGVKKGTPASSP
ncbi:penicillin-binding protein 1C [Limnohabitans sp. T6-5]|uniref:penicillin-binding protein 1C n=1 Tax=Limnohabitans sp. T6-5 TaxID=1100724 RepID=UPI000D350F9F|nr:penicillin-binding protein 1C [Limnohabitans sp. T6-5]